MEASRGSCRGTVPLRDTLPQQANAAPARGIDPVAEFSTPATSPPRRTPAPQPCLRSPFHCALDPVSHCGSAMGAQALYDRVGVHTREAFGRSLSPHLFRDCAFTGLGI